MRNLPFEPRKRSSSTFTFQMNHVLNLESCRASRQFWSRSRTNKQIILYNDFVFGIHVQIVSGLPMNMQKGTQQKRKHRWAMPIWWRRFGSALNWSTEGVILRAKTTMTWASPIFADKNKNAGKRNVFCRKKTLQIQTFPSRLLNDEWALARAKANVEHYFPVVGVLEELNKTLELFEQKIPYFFKGAQTLYYKDILRKSLFVVKKRFMNVFCNFQDHIIKHQKNKST